MRRDGTGPVRPGGWLPGSVRPGGWLPDVALLAGFALLSLALARGHLLTLDQGVAGWVDGHRPTPLHWTARVLNYLGQGGQVLMPAAILLAGAVAWRRRSVRPLLAFAGALLLTYVTIGPLKLWFDRAAPHSTLPDRAELFNSLPPGEYGLSYPSGHVANALVWYGVIALLAGALLRALDRPPLRPATTVAIRALPPVIVFVTTTYLGFHWLTDSIAGLLLGLLLTRLLARVGWDDLPLPALRNGWHRAAGLDRSERAPGISRR